MCKPCTTSRRPRLGPGSPSRCSGPGSRATGSSIPGARRAVTASRRRDLVARVRAMRAPRGRGLVAESGGGRDRRRHRARDCCRSIALRLGGEGIRGRCGERPAGLWAEAFAGCDQGSIFVAAARAMNPRWWRCVLDDVFSRGSFEWVAHWAPVPRPRGVSATPWARGEVSVGAEHMASHAVQRRLALALEAGRHDPGYPDRLLASSSASRPGARHELGALAFAVAARRAGDGRHVPRRGSAGRGMGRCVGPGRGGG